MNNGKKEGLKKYKNIVSTKINIRLKKLCNFVFDFIMILGIELFVIIYLMKEKNIFIVGFIGFYNLFSLFAVYFFTNKESFQCCEYIFSFLYLFIIFIEYMRILFTYYKYSNRFTSVFGCATPILVIIFVIIYDISMIKNTDFTSDLMVSTLIFSSFVITKLCNELVIYTTLPYAMFSCFLSRMIISANFDYDFFGSGYTFRVDKQKLFVYLVSIMFLLVCKIYNEFFR